MSKSSDYIVSICQSQKIGRIFDEGDEPPIYFTNHEFEILKSFINIIDAREGGLIIGNSHEDGGVQMIQEIEDGYFKFFGEIEGGEYLYPIKKDDHKIDFLVEINKKFTYNIKELIIPKDCQLINVSGEEIQVILVSKFYNYIVNKQNTKTFIEQIVNIINDR